ncbi:MAG: sulfotransferase family 2 domain-containing protein [Opitutae bacterium]|nr:sulfotransferase family 2 domain-containing protein [Opitutae bacterium]MDG1300652.1 sulfotransferase family 2 domain-containing protein [Opitutae bacterium]
MLISHRYKFIYTKTAKTAGTSIESYFEPFCQPEGEWEQLHGRDSYESDYGIIGERSSSSRRKSKWYNHMPADEIKTLIGDEKWNSYFKFCSIRNPWDKAISGYFHFGKNIDPSFRTRVIQRIKHPTLSQQQHHFLSWLKESGPPIDKRQYLINNTPCMDKFIRFEHMEEDIQSICEILDLPRNESSLPHFKGHHRDPSITPPELYSKPAHKVIEELYAYEIEHFNYSYTPE